MLLFSFVGLLLFRLDEARLFELLLNAGATQPTRRTGALLPVARLHLSPFAPRKQRLLFATFAERKATFYRPAKTERRSP
jgi:hypothetical protein